MSATPIFDLDLEGGERLVVFGPNGAGKTTLLRSLADRLDAAYLPQRPYMFRGKAQWNLLLGLDDAEQQRALALADQLGITQVGERQARRLSGGEAARLALARVLASSREVLLLDEPLAALDARDRLEVVHILRREIGGRTAVVVTHDPTEAALLADRLAVVIEGAVHQSGPVDEVMTRPASDAVARVLGVGNALDGTVTEVSDTLVTVDLGPVVAAGVGVGAAGSSARVLFAAEAVALHSAPVEGSARNTWPGRIAEMRPMGRLVEVVVDVGLPIAAALTPGAVDALRLEVGSSVIAAVKATAVSVVGR